MFLLLLACIVDRPVSGDLDTSAHPDDPNLTDGDDDGYVDDDCDDQNAAVNPGAVELCNGLDDDCDGQVDEDLMGTLYADSDGDGFGDAMLALDVCEGEPGWVANADDCDDTNPAISPAATELCNGIDDNCDGAVDEGTGHTYYGDADMDGFGDAAQPIEACEPPPGYVLDASDCDDAEVATYPGAPEVCDEADNDCDTEVDEEVTPTWYEDGDGDGFGTPSAVSACEQPAGYAPTADDCDDEVPTIYPGAPEVCDGIDQDCDTLIDEGFDSDGDGTPDCSDSEVCDGVDNDGDGLVDEPDAVDTTTWERDADGDGYGDPSVTLTQCDAPAGYVDNADDCDDADGTVHPGATELCNGVDDDCNGGADDGLTFPTWYADADGDGYGDSAVTTLACAAPAGYVAIDGDCDDTDASLQVCSSCLDILDAGLSVGDGVYTLDPCGTGSADYYCDMTTDGGGWTVAGWQAASGTQSLGVSDWGTVGTGDWSTNLACVPYDEIMVSNETYALHYSDTYTASTFSATAGEFTIGASTDAFVQGWYGPGGYTMACVNLNATYGAPAYGCDNDWTGGQQGHITDYAGEFCTSGRLDSTWAWATGSSCLYRGSMYTWSWELR